MKLLRLLLLLWGIGFVQFAVAEERCDLNSGIELSNRTNAPWKMHLVLSPKEVPLNAPFSVILIICSGSKHQHFNLEVDAMMPAHKHGMNYIPKITKVDGNKYEVENLLFHMPGTWRFEITAFENERPHRFTHDIELQ